ncbi:MAG: DUF5943 domain-containing protein [Janthinobacterium lividum]
MQPKVDIDVNETTGTWVSDGLPMLYVPRHFMVNVHDEVADALGRDAYQAVLERAGSKSAYFWCKKRDELERMGGVKAFQHYLERLTARGWGQFEIEDLDIASGLGRIRLRNSIYVLESRQKAEHPVCYMFEGFFIGGFRYLLEEQGTPRQSITCREIQCEAMGFDHCRFDLQAS